MSAALPLIAPKPFAEYGAQEYYDYVTGMYALRVKRGAKPPGPAPGLSLSRTKAGALSIRRSRSRAFDYVLDTEIIALAKAIGAYQSDVWNAFVRRRFIIAKSRMQAEETYAAVKEIPW